MGVFLWARFPCRVWCLGFEVVGVGVECMVAVLGVGGVEGVDWFDYIHEALPYSQSPRV